ncbi:hypothetical protein BC833DRAFT_577077 [Globomyces pollinis-pini]|nr:hypothetical protein BC833DRAFT_577077 [Globomyces pollinis-pini]
MQNTEQNTSNDANVNQNSSVNNPVPVVNVQSTQPQPLDKVVLQQLLDAQTAQSTVQNTRMSYKAPSSFPQQTPIQQQQYFGNNVRFNHFQQNHSFATPTDPKSKRRESCRVTIQNRYSNQSNDAKQSVPNLGFLNRLWKSSSVPPNNETPVVVDTEVAANSNDDSCILCCEQFPEDIDLGLFASDPVYTLPCCKQLLHVDCYDELRKQKFDNCIFCRAHLPTYDLNTFHPNLLTEDELLIPDAIERTIEIELDCEAELNDGLVDAIVTVKGVVTNQNDDDFENNRPGMDLLIVVDVSGSMSGTPLKLVQESLVYLIDHQLKPQDRISLVKFSTTATLVSKPRGVTAKNKPELLSMVEKYLFATNSTNIFGGIHLAAEVLKMRERKNPMASILLLSDGEDTCGLQTDSLGLIKLCKDLKKDFLPIHTFGYGRGHDSKLMKGISDMTGGAYSFIESNTDVPVVFASAVGGMTSLILQNVSLKFNIESMEDSQEIIDVLAGSYETKFYDKAGKVDLFNMLDGESRKVIVKIKDPLAHFDVTPLKVTFSYSYVNETEIHKQYCDLTQFVPFSHSLHEQLAYVEFEKATAKALLLVDQRDTKSALLELNAFNQTISKMRTKLSTIGEHDLKYLEDIRSECDSMIEKLTKQSDSNVTRSKMRETQTVLCQQRSTNQTTVISAYQSAKSSSHSKRYMQSKTTME